MITDDFSYYFNSILTRGRKDNSYKFAMARFLLDYAYNLDDSAIGKKLENGSKEIIEFRKIASAFLKYYWHQICKYKIRQNYNTEKLPLVVQIIRNVFGKEYIPESFKSMDKIKIAIAEEQITKKCFAEVVPRFQNITDGIHVMTKKTFYEYYDNEIAVRLEALRFFRANYHFLFKSVILEWAKFLEKINYGLPMLISKIEGEEVQRSSLEKVKSILKNYFDKCFYCDRLLPVEKHLFHVDHFIPWSYVFEDELWNLVLACRNCNLKKHSSLSPERFVTLLTNRNIEYCDKIEGLNRSIQRLTVDGNPGRVLFKHYQNCMDYGFTLVNM